LILIHLDLHHYQLKKLVLSSYPYSRISKK
jgi:hypothetical protein